jgi:hypothetical protein
MDVKPMTSIEISDILRKDPCSKLCFIGVFPRDQLPVITMYPVAFVLNTDPSYKVGEHWLGIYFDNRKKCYFFDSFGNEPEYFGLEKYINKYSVDCEFNNSQIQGVFSNTCGHFTIFFILFITRGYSLKDIRSCFNLKKYDLNDFRISFISQ